MIDRHVFRGKRVDNGEWVMGYYISMTHTDGRHTHHFIMPMDTDMNYGVLLENCLIEVIYETIGQCTGLTDKNGKRIFEGDIVLFGQEYKIEHYIYRQNETCSFILNPIFKFDNSKPLLESASTRMYEIIGNIHDNPELLEDKQND